MCIFSYLSWAWAAMGGVLSASLPVVISGIVTYIAWQQFTVNRRQHRLALFEKRMVVFNSTMTMIASVVQSANPTLAQSFQFMKDTRDHEFLFGPEVGEFINEVYSKAVKLHTFLAVNNPQNAAQQAQVMEWFVGQMGEARKIFLPYLDFRKP
jgi:hypothetical protein